MCFFDIGVFQTSDFDGILESVFGFVVEETTIACCFGVTACKLRVRLVCYVEDNTHQGLITPDAPQSVIQYRAIVQRDRLGPQISLDSSLL
jgi:hypothetical protein